MSYEPVIATLAARPIAAVAARVSPEAAGQVIFSALDRVHAVVQRASYGPFWGDVVLCEGEDERGVLDLRIGVGLARPFPGVGAVAPWTTPGGEAVRVTHTGPYSQRGRAHEAAKVAAPRLGLRLTGVNWEVHGAFDIAARTRPTEVFYEAVQ